MAELKLNNQTPVPAYYYEKEDEISLVDLWLVLAKRKNLIFAAILFCMAMAILATFLFGEKTTFITTVKIGGDVTSIESNEDVIAKLQENYIPIINNQRDTNFKIDTRIPKGSSLIILETITSSDFKNEVSDLHSDVGQLLINDHDRQLALKVSTWKNQIDTLNQTQSKLQSSPYTISLQSQIVELRNQLIKTDNQNETLRNNLKDELRFLQVELAKESNNLVLKEIEIREKIDGIQEQINNLNHTTLLTTALETGKSSKSPLIIIVLGIIVGFMFGIFLAFLAEFFNKVKTVQAEQASAQAEH